MCEKPMATSVGDCVRMLRDVTSAPMSGKVFAIGHVMRYSPYNVAVREVIDSGVLGDIVDVQVSTTSMPRTQILTNSTQSRSGTSTLLTRLFGEAGASSRSTCRVARPSTSTPSDRSICSIKPRNRVKRGQRRAAWSVRTSLSVYGVQRRSISKVIWIM
jgi:hypothetical protein